MRVYKSRGVILELDGVKLCFDGSSKCNVGFISHAHSDHLVSREVNHKFITSNETKILSEYRTGFKLNHYSNNTFNGLNFKLIDNGHIFGSRALFIQGTESVLYTGDFSTRSRFFLNGFKPIKCDNLIIETTYGNPNYSFPDTKQVIKEARDYIVDEFARGNNLVLKGYALGKAQLISKLVEGCDNVYVDNRVLVFNDLCRSCGADLPFFKTGRLKGRFILISPEPRRDLKAKNVGFTGWALNNWGGFDECFPLSDHADFKDLLKVVKQCNPKRVFTHHGFAGEFAELLRLEGYDAAPL